MAVEKRVIRASRYDEEMIVNEYSWFGWELISDQDVYSENVSIEYYALQPWLVTHTTDYVKLVFERDKSRSNYDELVRLEKQYFQSMDIYINSSSVHFGWIRGFICAFLVICGISIMEKSVISAIIWMIIPAFIILLRIRKVKKEHAVAEYALRKAEEAKINVDKIV